MSENNLRLKIHVYSVMSNEQTLLPYWLRHYTTFAQRIFIIDDKSSDETVEIAKASNKVTMLKYKFSDNLIDAEHVDCFHKYYKQYSRGKVDWVMCVDGDEFIHHPKMMENLQLQRQRGIQVIRTTGYAMISRRLPKSKKQIYEELPWGLRERRWDKPCVFDPKLDIVFGSGQHYLKAPTDIQPRRGKLSMLHYRYLSRRYFLNRSRNLVAKLKIRDKLKTWLIRGGLKFYDTAVKSNLEKVV